MRGRENWIHSSVPFFLLSVRTWSERADARRAEEMGHK